MDEAGERNIFIDMLRRLGDFDLFFHSDNSNIHEKIPHGWRDSPYGAIEYLNEEKIPKTFNKADVRNDDTRSSMIWTPKNIVKDLLLR